MKKSLLLLCFTLVILFTFNGCSNDKKTQSDSTNKDFESAKLQLDIENGDFGFIDESGNVVIDYAYDYAEPFKEGRALVQLDNRYGFINKKGELIIPCKYESAHSYSDGLALVIEDNKYKYIDKDGNKAFDMDFSDANSFSEGMAVVGISDYENGYIDTTGKIVIPCENEYAYPFSEGWGLVCNDGVHEFIDKSGNVVLTWDGDSIFPFKEGVACAKDGRRWGFIDKSGNEVEPFEYYGTYDFSEGLAKVWYSTEGIPDNAKGFINHNGELVLGDFYDAGDFHNGYAVVSIMNSETEKYGIIDTGGNMVVPYGNYGISYVAHDVETNVTLFRISEGDFYHYFVINSKGIRNF